MTSRTILSNFFEEQWTQNRPTVPFGIVACTFSDNLSRNSCILTTFLHEHRRRKPPRGIRGRTPQGYFFYFYFLSPLSWFSQSFRQDIGQIATWKVFLLLTIYFFMKNVTDFRKMVETGVDLRLQFKTLFWTLCSKLLRLTFQTMKGKGKQEPILTG